MSKHNLEKTLRQELENLNDLIDQKIIKGLSYTKEARRHKFLLSSLTDLTQSKKIRQGWFGVGSLKRSFSFISSFIL